MWLLPDICQVVYIQKHHVKKDGVVVHSISQFGQTSAMDAHSSTNTIHWIDKNIREGLLVTQIVKKQEVRVLAITRNRGIRCTNKDMFIGEQNIHNVAHNHTCETYIRHANDDTGVRMWVEENKNDAFYYQDGGLIIQDILRRANIPFTNVATEAMLKHGHKSGVSIGTTFGTNVKM